MKTKIKVTQEDIDKGRVRSHLECPVALAVRRTIGNVSAVGPSTIDIGYWDRYRTPDIASNFIFLFDRGFRRELTPFEFELDIKDLI